MKIEKITEGLKAGFRVLRENLSSFKMQQSGMKKTIASFLCFMFLMQQTSLLSVLASDITVGFGDGPIDITPGNNYNINGQFTSGATDFRNYNGFNLSDGNTANLIFSGGANKFVNLVGGLNPITINGIVNTMKSNNFYNGHAIFVSPNGMVVGASGVLNVGALSVYTSPLNKVATDIDFAGIGLDDLINVDIGLNAPIKIHGKIFARDGVELVAKQVYVEKDTLVQNAPAPAIFSGMSDSTYNKALNYTDNTAETLFNSLVNTGVARNSNPTFANVNGKIVIKAQDVASKTAIMNLDETRDTKAEVVVKGAYLDGVGIDISANAASNYDNRVTNPVQDLNDIIEDIDNLVNGNITELMFGFEGANSVASVLIEDSSLKAIQDVNISSSAIAEAKYTVTEAGVGTIPTAHLIKNVANSKVEVKNTEITAKNDVNINAIAVSDLDMKISDSSFLTLIDDPLKMTVAIVFNDSKSSVLVDTVDKSIKSKNLDINAINVVNQTLDIAYSTGSIPGLGGKIPALGAVVAVTSTDISTKAGFNGKFESTDNGNLTVNAQTLHVGDNNVTVSAEIDGAEGKIGNALKGLQSSLLSLLPVALKLPAIDLSFLPSLSGAVVVNSSDIVTEAVIGNTSNIKANTVTLNANTIDLTSNQAVAKSSIAKTSQEGKLNASAGIAVVVNNQNIKTTAEIEDGTSSSNKAVITAKDVKVNATSELPQNFETLQLALGAYNEAGELISDMGDILGGDILSLGDALRGYLSGSIGDSIEEIMDIKLVLKRGSLGAAGFVNNYASSSGKGGDVGIAGSVVYSNVDNSTLARIGNFSEVTASNSAIVNAANKVLYINFAGDIGSSIIPGFGTSSGDVGLGGSLVLSFNNHDAISQVGENAAINGSAGSNVEINAATSQKHINIAAGGGKAGDTAVTGSVAVVEVGGLTEASVGKNAKITAKFLALNAGKASIAVADRINGGVIGEFIGLEDGEDKLTLKNKENITDDTLIVTVTGAVSAASGGSDSTDVAVGASVGVNLIDKEVKASIGDGAEITIDKLDVLANTDSLGVSVALAGAFAGGVSADKTNQAEGEKEGTLQKLKNLGGWQDKVAGILNKASGLASSAAGKSDGAVNAGNADLANSNTSSALNDTNNNAAGTNGNSNGNIGNSVSNSNDLSGGAGQASAKTGTDNISIAAAGSVNATISESKVSAQIGNAKITQRSTTTDNVNISATQNSLLIDVSGAVGVANTAGAGAALNLNMNSNETIAGSSAQMNLNNSNLNIIAKDSQFIIDAAVGVGATKSGNEGGSDGTSAAIGGSFNVSVIDNSVNSYLGGKVMGAKDVNVDAINKTQAIKAAGGVAVSASGSNTQVGAGVAANLNFITKETIAQIQSGADITATGDVSVATNSKKGLTEPSNSFDYANLFKYSDEFLFSGAVAAAIVTGGKSAFTFSGALGADVLNNSTQALINSGSKISSNTLSIVANDYICNSNVAGSFSFSAASNSYGVGLGAIVEVATNDTNAKVDNATITTKGKVDVRADYEENLNFLAVNGGVTTGGGVSVTINGIANVLLNTINSEIAGSTITSGDLNIISNYAAKIQGVTVVLGLSAGSANPISGNIIANVLDSTNSAKLKDSTVTAGGKLSVKATSNEELDINSASVSATASGNAAVAGNIAATVLLNDTTAEISSNKEVKAVGVDVIASDNTLHKNRGGTVAISGGTAGVGGSILVDVYHKTVNALIGSGTKIASSGGDVKVSAGAQNYFGPKNTIEIGNLDALVSEIGLSDLDKVGSLGNWQMTFDAAGGSTAGVSGSLIVKVINNNVAANIGENANITSKNLTVDAVNDTVVRAIVGNLTGAGTAAIGGSFFVNVVTGTTEASISDGVKVSASDDVTVKAETIEDVRTIMVVGGGAGTVAVNGSANVNVFVNDTNATIGNAQITSTGGGLIVDAKETIDIQSINLAANGAGTVSVGAVGFVNTISNNVDAGISGATINTKNNILVNAESKEAFGATFLVVSGAGTAAIAGLGVANVISSDINAYINQNSNITSTNGKVDVSATHNFNEWKYNNKTSNIAALIRGLVDGSITDINFENYTPIVTALNVTGAGTAAVGGTALFNTFDTDVHAKVENSTISTLNGLNINAVSKETTYDILATAAFSGCAAVTGTILTNIASSDTSAELVNTIISKGNVNVDASQTTNFNSIIGGASGAATAAISGYVTTNVIVNSVKALIDRATIYDSASVIANSLNKVDMNSIGIGVAVAGVGAAVQALVLTSVHDGENEAVIKNSTIKKGATQAKARNEIGVSNIIGSASASVKGANASLNVATTVMTNDLSAHIDNSTLENNTSTVVDATSVMNLDNYSVSAGINGIGASLGGTALTNVIDNDINAYICASSKITNGTVGIGAQQTTNLIGGIAAVNFGGLSVAGNANGSINIFTDRVSAYSDNSTYTNVSAMTVNASSTESINFLIAAIAGAGLAGVSGSAIVNTINNDLSAYINGGSITGGTITVASNQIVDISANTAGLTAGSFAAGAGAVVNVLTNESNAYINNTQIDNTGKIAVSATSEETLENIDVNAAFGGTAVGLSVVVNVIENSTNAKIDAKTKSVKTTGDMTVEASNTLNIDNIAGSVAAGNVGAAGSANVNIVNNAVSAQLLSDSTGSVEAKNIKVDAKSDLTLDTKTASAAGGMAGLSGTVSLSSIGSKFNTSDKDASYKSSETLTETTTVANSNNKTVAVDVKDKDGNVVKNKKGESVNNSYTPESVELTSGTAKEGTVANINANITKSESITVSAANKLDFDVINSNIAGGIGAAGASVLVTDMNYKTTAKISGKNIVSSGDISVTANNIIEADTNAVAATVGGVAINGNAAYFNNKAVTAAQIENAAISSARNVSVIADSINTIDSKAISGSAGLAVVNIAISQAADANNTKASIKNSTITNSGNTDVKASTTSNLTSEVLAATIGGVAASVVVNNAYVSAVTEALIEGTSDINTAGNFNLISATGGLNTVITMYIGSLGYLNVGASVTQAKTSGIFNAKVLGTSKVKASNVAMKAGVSKANNNNAGSATATINSKAATIGVYNASVTTQNATVDANTNIITDAGTTVEATNGITILSALNRTASTGQSSANLGVLDIGALKLNSVISGTSNIAANGTLIANTIDMNIRDAATASARMLSASLTLVSGSSVDATASINQNAYITTNNINANTINIDTYTTKDANIYNASFGASLIGVGLTNMTAQTGGTSGVTMNGTVRGNAGEETLANALTINVKDVTSAKNDSATFGISFASGNSMNITSSADSRIENSIGGDINAKNVSLTNNLNRTTEANSASSSVSLANISGMSLVSRIVNGATTIFGGKIKGDNLTVNSNMTNNTKVDMKDNTVALAAFGSNGVKNDVSSNVVNTVKFNSADINLSGMLTANANLTNNLTMTGKTDSGGFLSAKGSSLFNNINTKSAVEFNNSKIKANKMSVLSKSSIASTSAIKLSNAFRGFASGLEATISNTLNQTSDILISNSDIDVKSDLTFNARTDSNFAQETAVNANGFTCSNEAYSYLEVNNNNNFKVLGNSDVHANNVVVNLDSSNDLSSKADSSASHFAGQPGVDSKLTLNINNNMEVGTGSTLWAKNLVNMNFLKNSKNNLVQDAYVYAQAAIASANWGGLLTYNTVNKLNVKTGGKIISNKDVVINYSNGSNSLTSRVAYKKVSRALFGIPITSSGSSSRISTSSSNTLNLDGTIEAGAGNSRTILIDKDGNVDKSKTDGFEETDYQILETDTVSGADAKDNVLEAVQEEIDYLNQRIDDLTIEKDNNEAEIKANQTEIAKLDAIIGYLEGKTTITEEDVQTAINNAIYSVTLQSAQNNGSGHEGGDFDSNALKANLWSEAALMGYLNQVYYLNDKKEKVYYMQGTPAANVLAAYNYAVGTQKNNITTVSYGSNEVSLYGGKIIIQDTYDNAVIGLLNAAGTSKDNLSARNTALGDANGAIDKNIIELGADIVALNTQKTDLANLDMADLAGVNGSILFKDIIVKPSKIEITGLNFANGKPYITGSGQFILHGTGLLVDNYSNRSLIFNNINLMGGLGTGLTINGTSYNSYANNPTAYIGQNTVTLIKTSDTDMSINNYFDHNNPDAIDRGLVHSNIILNGSVLAGALNTYIWNESGDITFKNGVTTTKKLDVIASQGDVKFENSKVDVTIKSGDRIFAGKNVSITARNIENNGAIIAGNADRKVIITDEMLANLIVDPNTGLKNMINLSPTEKSAYLNSTSSTSGGNIKALYVNGEIVLFNTDVLGGNVTLTGNVSGNGSVTYTSGAGSVVVDNQTAKNLVVCGVDNKSDGGLFTGKGGFAGTVATKGIATGLTDIKSIGAVNVLNRKFFGTEVQRNNIDVGGELNIASQKGLTVNGKIKNKKGNTTITNTVSGDLTVASTGVIENDLGNLELNNAGSGKLEIQEDGKITNKGELKLVNSGVLGMVIAGSATNTGNTILENTAGGLTVSSTGVVQNTSGDVLVDNSGAGGISILGKIKNLLTGNTTIINSGGGVKVASTGSITNANGSTSITNTGLGGVEVEASGLIENAGGNLSIVNNNASASKIEIAGIVQNTGANAANELNILNKGENGILISGTVKNILGVTNVENQNTGADSQIHLTSTGTITNSNGNLTLKNVGKRGILVEGIIKTLLKDIFIDNKDSDIVIGDNTYNDNYLNAQNGNVKITFNNGDLLNSGVDKTLIKVSGGNLVIEGTDGNIGAVNLTNPASGAGVGVEASTRDAKESVNINVTGTITASALNSPTSTARRLINLRSKNSDMNVNKIKADGDVMLSAVDWRQADIDYINNPQILPSNYFNGYSILNSAGSGDANVEGYNISLVSSNNIGNSSKWFTFNQIDTANSSWLSAEAENDLYLRALSDDYDSNVWQLISKRGNMGVEFSGNTIVREVTAAKHLDLITRGKMLTIYDLGRLPHMLDPLDDILYPHDLISLNGVVPETIKLTVLDINQRTRTLGDTDGNSILNVYNAFVKGQSKWDTINGVYQPLVDITLKADTIIANAYGSPSSSISTVARPNGFDANEGREYFDDPLAGTGGTLQATGFNSYGAGNELVFDILGVSPDDVSAIGRSINDRTYNEQTMIETIQVFTNKLAVDVLNYKAKDVRLSVNSNNITTNNRGTIMNHLYADNAYIDTRDLNMNFRDAFITNYAEFRNGNRGGTGGYVGDYRWTTIVDNDYRRLVLPATLQLYTQKTGSFALDMGNLIVVKTVAPAVHYNPYEVTNLPRTENSFTRLTYKDDKIQEDTTTPRFNDIDKDTYKPGARRNLRFNVQNSDGGPSVEGENNSIQGILDISKGGLALEHDGSLKVGDKMNINLSQDDVSIEVEIQIVRIAGNRAGAKFINMDKATANKILYLNMLSSK